VKIIYTTYKFGSTAELDTQLNTFQDLGLVIQGINYIYNGAKLEIYLTVINYYGV